MTMSSSSHLACKGTSRRTSGSFAKEKHQRWVLFYKNHHNQKTLSLNCITRMQIFWLRKEAGVQSCPAQLHTPPSPLFLPSHRDYVCPCFTFTASLAQGKLPPRREPAEGPSFWSHPLLYVLDSYLSYPCRNTVLLYTRNSRISVLSLLQKTPLI